MTTKPTMRAAATAMFFAALLAGCADKPESLLASAKEHLGKNDRPAAIIQLRSALQKDADWMKRWTSTVVTVEGHCDSRGSSEYNLALGNRRANAVKDYLVSLGVPGGRVTVVSKGKEQPFCSEENESCWQQNRRGHFLVTAK